MNKFLIYYQLLQEKISSWFESLLVEVSALSKLGWKIDRAVKVKTIIEDRKKIFVPALKWFHTYRHIWLFGWHNHLSHVQQLCSVSFISKFCSNKLSFKSLKVFLIVCERFFSLYGCVSITSFKNMTDLAMHSLAIDMTHELLLSLECIL